MAAKSITCLKGHCPHLKKAPIIQPYVAFFHIWLWSQPHMAQVQCDVGRSGQAHAASPWEWFEGVVKMSRGCISIPAFCSFSSHHFFLHTDSSFTARPASSTTTFLYPESNSRIDDVIHTHTGFESLIWQAYCTLYKGQWMQHKL